jgi:hypothetical protein
VSETWGEACEDALFDRIHELQLRLREARGMMGWSAAQPLQVAEEQRREKDLIDRCGDVCRTKPSALTVWPGSRRTAC